MRSCNLKNPFLTVKSYENVKSLHMKMATVVTLESFKILCQYLQLLQRKIQSDACAVE